MSQAPWARAPCSSPHQSASPVRPRAPGRASQAGKLRGGPENRICFLLSLSLPNKREKTTFWKGSKAGQLEERFSKVLDLGRSGSSWFHCF